MTAAASAVHRRDVIFALGFGVAAVLIAAVPSTTAKAAVFLALFVAPAAAWLIAGPLRWIPVFIALAWLLPPLPIEIGNSGPHVAVLIAAAGLLSGVVRLDRWRIDIDAVSFWLFALVAIFTLSLASAFAYSGVVIGEGSAARLALFAISAYGFAYIRFGPGRSQEAFVRRMVSSILWAGAVSAIIAIVDFYYQLPAPAGYGPQFIWLDTGVFRRAQGMFYEASTLGNLCAFVLEMIVVALVLRPKPLRIRVATLIVCAVPLSTALVLSYSRASVVNVAVAIVVLLWLLRNRIRLVRTALIGAVVILFGAALLSWVFPTFFDVYLMRVAASMQYFGEAPNAVLSGRLQTWTHLTSYIADNPLRVLFGIGYKTLPYSDVTGTTAIADNTYLSVLVETGVAGLAALCALNMAILTACYRAFRADDPMRSFLGAWFLCFWCGQMVQMMSADLLTYWRVLPAYLCVLALATRKPAEVPEQ